MRRAFSTKENYKSDKKKIFGTRQRFGFVRKTVRFLLYLVFICITFFAFLNIDIPVSFYGDYLFNNEMYSKSSEVFDFLSEIKPGNEVYELKSLRASSYLPFTYSVQTKFINAALKDDNSVEEEFATEAVKNFRKEIFKSYGTNYTQDCLYNGIVMRWDKNTFPLTYSVSTEHPMPAYYLYAVDKAFEEWQSGTDGFIKFKKVRSNADISVVFSETGIEKKLDKNFEYKAAVTKPFIENDKFLKKMEIKVLIRDYFGRILEPGEMKTILAHEIGHALGLWGHTEDPGAIMYYSRKKPYSYYADRNLTSLNAKDINTMKLLYALAPDVSNTSEALTDKEDAISAKALFSPLDENISSNTSTMHKDWENLAEDPTDTVNYAVELTNSKQYEKSNRVLFSIYYSVNDDKIKGKILSLSAFNYAKNGELKKALNNAKIALSYDANSENYETLAYVCFCGGYYDVAEKYYKIAINKDSTNKTAYYGLTNTFVKKFRFLAARNVLHTLKKNNPSAKHDTAFKRYFFLFP